MSKISSAKFKKKKILFVFMELISSAQHKKCDITKKVFINTGSDMAFHKKIHPNFLK